MLNDDAKSSLSNTHSTSYDESWSLSSFDGLSVPNGSMSMVAEALSIASLKSQEEEQKESKRARRCRLAGNIACGLLVILGLYSILAIIIAERSDMKSGTVSKQKVFEAIGDEGCGAESFMIRDSVCDEKTNIELCLYDGGDCCLDEGQKDLTLCRTCLCLVSVDEDLIATRFQKLDVKAFDADVYDSSALLFVSHVSSPVVSNEICSQVCLDPGLEDIVNGWLYNFERRTCTCAWFESRRCSDQVDLLAEMSPKSPENIFGTAVYIQMNRMLTCTCLEMNRRIYSKKEVSIDDIINTELTAASAWHCFKECQADEFCRAFSWQHEGDGVCKLFGNDDNEDNIVAAAPTATAEQGWITGTPECSTIDLTAAISPPTTTSTTTINKDIWSLESGLYVHMKRETMQFYTAVQYCFDLGGRLYEPRTPLEANHVIGIACDIGLCPIWMGVDDGGNEGTFTYFSNGESVPNEVMKWRSGEPNNHDNIEHFIIADKKYSGYGIYEWVDHEAIDPGIPKTSLNPHKFVVEGLVCEHNPGRPDNETKISDELTVFFHYETMRIGHAIAYCDSRGGRVYEPRNMMMAYQVEEFARDQRLWLGFWVGIYEKHVEGKFVYISDDLPVPELNMNWQQGEPNGDYLGYVSHSFHGVYTYHLPPGWNDVDSSHECHVICEKL